MKKHCPKCRCARSFSTSYQRVCDACKRRDDDSSSNPYSYSSPYSSPFSSDSSSSSSSDSGSFSGGGGDFGGGGASGDF